MQIHSIVECHQGWKELYQPIIDKIIQHDNAQTNSEDKIGILHVKENVGCLDIKVITPKNLTIPISREIRKAQILSEGICEYCGTHNRVGHTSLDIWRKSCCNECWKKYIIPNQPRSRWTDDSATTAKYIKEIEEI